MSKTELAHRDAILLQLRTAVEKWRELEDASETAAEYEEVTQKLEDLYDVLQRAMLAMHKHDHAH